MAEISARGSKGHHTFYLSVVESGTSTANNTSTVTINFWLVDDNNWYFDTWGSRLTYTVTVNGTTYSGNLPDHDTKTTYIITNQTQTITHDSDGSKTISFSFSTTDSTGQSYTPGTSSASGTLTLTTIPRASDVTVSNYSIVNTTGSLSATITSKANFYHRWRWKLADGSWSSWTNKGAINNTSATVTVANTTLLAQLPSATSGAFTIEVETHSGTAYSSATLIGTKQATCTVSVDTSKIKPSVSLGNIGINSSPISNYAVAGYSKVQSAFTTTNSSGASGVTTYFTVSNGSLATTSSTSTSGTVVSNVIPSNSSNYTLTIYAYAKDSRGAISDTVSKAITVYGYEPPTATLNAYRTSTSSSTNEDGAGTYAYVTFSGAVRSSVNSQNTVQSVVCTYSGSISGTATSGGHYALADNQAVTFTLTVTDKVTSSTAVVNITSAIYPLDLVDDGNGHVGGGFATLAEINKFKFGLPVEVDGAVTATQFNGNATSATSADNATTATNANNVKVTATNPTSGTVYYIPFHSGASGNKALCANDGLTYNTVQGTASTLGYGLLAIGNSTQSGTAGNKYGRLYLYDRYNHRVELRAMNQLTANRTIQFPDKAGVLAIEDTTLWTGSLTGTNSINLDISAYKRIRIYAQYATTQQMIWEVDVTKLHATTQYRANHCEMSWLDSAWYHIIFETFISKAKFTLSNVYNMNSSGTTYAQNSNSAYAIYRIDGIL